MELDTILKIIGGFVIVILAFATVGYIAMTSIIAYTLREWVKGNKR